MTIPPTKKYNPKAPEYMIENTKVISGLAITVINMVCFCCSLIPINDKYPCIKYKIAATTAKTIEGLLKDIPIKLDDAKVFEYATA